MMQLANKAEKIFVDKLVADFQVMGPARAKAMFGGYGIYIDEYMVGLVADSVLYLKVDTILAKAYAEKNLPHFTYHKNGRVFNMSYCQAPAEITHDIEMMVAWVSKSYDVAKRAKQAKKVRAKKA